MSTDIDQFFKCYWAFRYPLLELCTPIDLEESFTHTGYESYFEYINGKYLLPLGCLPLHSFSGVSFFLIVVRNLNMRPTLLKNF